MFYKVIKDNKIIDVLDNLVFLKYQPKHKRMILCDENEAQAIFSSDRSKIWHENSLYAIPTDGYDTVSIEEIDEYEYKQLKIFNCKTIEDTIDEFVLNALIGDESQFVASLKRLYDKEIIDKTMIAKLYQDKKISLAIKTQLLN